MVHAAKGEYRRIPATPAALPLINALGSRRGRARRQPVQVVRRRRHHERARPPAHHVAGRRHAAHRHRRGHADAALPLRFASFGASPRVRRRQPRAAGRASRAPRWERGPAGGGSLRVVTSNLRAGYLRKNGVPYSERATVSEHFDLAPLPDGGQLLLVTTDRRGSGVSERAVRREPALQEGARRLQVGSHTMLIDLVAPSAAALRRCCWSCCSALRVARRRRQFDLRSRLVGAARRPRTCRTTRCRWTTSGWR